MKYHLGIEMYVLEGGTDGNNFQVLKGDIKPAIETHEMLFQVIQRHNFLPEAFTTDFQV